MSIRALTALGLTAAWLGAALLLAASVAPAAFAVLPSRTLAGAIVGRVLPVVFISGLISAIVAALLLATVQDAGPRLAAVTAGALWAILCAVAQFLVSPRIERIRSAVAGPIDALSTTDPQRIAFGRLHGLSVGLLGLAMIAALVVVVSAGVAAHGRRMASPLRTTESTPITPHLV